MRGGKLRSVFALVDFPGDATPRPIDTEEANNPRFLGNEGDVPAPRRAEEVDAIFFELDALLDRTGELTEHTAKLLEELGKD